MPGLSIREHTETPLDYCCLQRREVSRGIQPWLRQFGPLSLSGLTDTRPAAWNKDHNMIKIKNQQVKTQVIQRLARIEGQLRGVQNMIAEDRDCKDVVQQLIAIRSAVQSASLNFVQEVASECLLSPNQGEDPQAQRAAMADVIKLLGKITE